MAQGKEPLVSICIPAYNGEIFVKRVLESCLRQTYRNIEIVFVDDKSTDGTLEIAQAYAKEDERLKVYQNERNLGAAENFLRSFKLAHGFFVQHLGIDDWIDPDHIEKKVEIFQRFPDTAFVTSAVVFYIKNGDGSFQLKNKMTCRPGIYSSDFVFKHFYLEKYRGLIGLIAMARRDDMVSNFLTNIPNQYGYENFYQRSAQAIDIAVFLGILAAYRSMCFLDNIFYNALVHEKRISAGHAEEKKYTAYVIKSQHVDSLCYGHFLKNKAPQYFSRYKVFGGANVIATILFSVLRSYRFNFREVVQNLKIFFKGYSSFEKVLVAIYIPWRIIERGGSWIRRSYNN